MRTGVALLGLAGVGLAVAVGYAVVREVTPLLEPDQCTATVGGRTVTLDPEQAENAALITAVSVDRGMPARAATIALATAYQESKIRNLDHGDRDSLGIFQQRPSMDWGTAKQVRDPYYATNAFYDALEKIPDYETMRITEAAQAVQRSGFPEAYEDHAIDARALASVLTGYSPGGLFTCVVHESEDRGNGDRLIRQVHRAFGDLGMERTGSRQDVALELPDSEAGERLGWAVSQFVVAHGVQLHPQRVDHSGKQWQTGRESEDGWTSGGDAGPSEVRVAMG